MDSNEFTSHLDANNDSSDELLSNKDESLPFTSPPNRFCDVRNDDSDYESLSPMGVAVALDRQEEMRELLLTEARCIHSIVPNQSLEQIYSFLEANMERELRVQIAMLQFLLLELPLDAFNRIESELFPPKATNVKNVIDDRPFRTFSDVQVPNVSNSPNVFDQSMMDASYKPYDGTSKQTLLPMTSGSGYTPIEDHLQIPSLDVNTCQPVPEMPIMYDSFKEPSPVSSRITRRQRTVEEHKQSISPNSVINKYLPGLGPVLSLLSAGKHMSATEPVPSILSLPATSNRTPVTDPVPSILSLPGTSKQMSAMQPVPPILSLPSTSKQMSAMEPVPPTLSLPGTSKQISVMEPVSSISLPSTSKQVGYIQNKQEIDDYIAARKAEKDAAYMKAQEAGNVMTCLCCFDDEIPIEDIRTCNEGHTFCKQCVKKGSEVRIGEGKTVIACFEECTGEFPLMILQTVLKPTMFSRLLQRKQLEEVKAASSPGLESCPFCNFAIIPVQEDRVFHCLNSECMKESCRLCRGPNHVPLRCDEVEQSDEVVLRTNTENKMTEPLVRCPLYTHDPELHLTAVIKETKKAKAQLKASNRNVKLRYDPTDLLKTKKAARITTVPQPQSQHNGTKCNVSQPHAVPVGRQVPPKRRRAVKDPPEEAPPQRRRAVDLT